MRKITTAILALTIVFFASCSAKGNIAKSQAGKTRTVSSAKYH